ncbi:hypothetical protein ACFQH6_05620 [Halobacteriaceae archaeon GCM10025711]
MTSLTEAYEARASEVGRQRVYLGAGLFAAGALLVVLGIVSGATPLLTDMGYTYLEAREVAGTLAGLGVPAVFVGVFAVLPTGRHQRAGAAIGASVTVLGVLLFRHIYPGQWFVESNFGIPTTQTLFVVAVYFVGVIVTFWYLFVAVATFKTRNDPGGTVSLEITRGGETRVVEVPREEVESVTQAASASPGGIGIIGDVDRRGVESAASDGGSSTEEIMSPMDDAGPQSPGQSGGFDAGPDDGEVVDDPRAHSTADKYCGNCAHFDYVRTERGIQPYCGQFDRTMDDMEACEEWQANNRR